MRRLSLVVTVSVIAAVATVNVASPTQASTPGTAVGTGGYHATIQRTTDGVPHISGATIGDALFGQGYANAEDHGCTLADAMLTPLGRRAATFGAGTDDANVTSDLAWRSIGLGRPGHR